MNTRYTETFLFLSRLSRRSNKGFALGFVLTAGVLMAATGAVMLLRSSSETEKVAAQETITKGKTTGEVAIARMQYFLGKYPFLAEMQMTAWQNADVDEQIKAQLKNTCEGQKLTQAQINAKVDKIKQEIGGYVQKNGNEYTWLKMDESQPKKGQFRFVDFKPAIAGEKMGTMTLEAMANVDNVLKETPTRLEVKIPLNENEADIKKGQGPGVWAKNAKDLDVILAAHVWIGSGGDDCSVTDNEAKINGINELVFGDKGGLAEAIKDRELPAGTTFDLAQVAEHKFPDEEKLQETYQKQITEIEADLMSITDSDGEGAAASDSSCGTQVDAAENGDWMVFPRPTDSQTRTQRLDNGSTLCIYDYEITESLDKFETVIRTVNNQGQRQRVIFHLKNSNPNTAVNLTKPEVAHVDNRDISGIRNIKDMPACTDSCKPVDFQVWGHNTEKICLIGNRKFHGFIWAPKAGLAVAGGGNTGGFNGVAFIDTWGADCTGNSQSKSGAQVVQTGEWEDLGIENPDMVPPITLGQPANVKTIEYYSSESPSESE